MKKHGLWVVVILVFVGIILGTLGTWSVPLGYGISAFWPAFVIQAAGSAWFGGWGVLAAVLFPILTNTLANVGLSGIFGFIPANLAQGLIPAWAFRYFRVDQAIPGRKGLGFYAIWGALIPAVAGGLLGSISVVLFGGASWSEYPLLVVKWAAPNMVVSLLIGIPIMRELTPLWRDLGGLVKGWWVFEQGSSRESFQRFRDAPIQLKLVLAMCISGLGPLLVLSLLELAQNGESSAAGRMTPLFLTISLVASVLAVGLISRETVRPLQELKEQVKSLMQYRDGVLTVERADEIGQLGQAFAFLLDDWRRADSLLQASESRFRLLAENSTDMISRHDAQGNYLYASPACRVILGYEPEELIGHSVFEFIHPDDIPAVDQSRSNIISRPVVSTIIFRARRNNGEYIWLETTSHTILDKETSSVLEIHAASRDVTERKRVEENLRQSEEKYRSIFENAIEGIFQSTPQGRFLRVNPAVVRMFGYTSAAEMITDITNIGQQIYAHPEDREKIVELMAKNGIIHNYEIECRRKDGSPIWVSVNMYKVRDPDGAVLYFEGALLDITARKRAEAQSMAHQAKLQDLLKEAEQSRYALLGILEDQKTAEEALRVSTAKLETLFQVSPLAITLLDINGDVQLWNPAAEKIFGWTSQEVIGQPNPIVPAGKQNEYSTWSVEILQGKVLANQEAVRQRKDGSLVDVSISSAPIHDATGNIAGRMALITDITERKQAEQSLRESENLYRKMNENSPLGMHFYKLEGEKLIFAGANPAADKLLGVDNSQFIGRTIEEAFPALIQTEVPARYRDAAANGIPWSREQIAYEDKQITGAFEVRAFQTAPGNMVAVFADITARKQAEDALRESEERFASLSESSFEGIVFSDKGIVIDCNEQLVAMLGYERTEIIGAKVSKFVAPESLEDVLVHIKSGSEESYEHLSLRKDGTKFPVEIRAKSLPYKGRMIRATTIQDITERKQAEDAIRRSEERLSSFMDSASDSFYLLDSDLRFIEINRRALEIVGKKKEDIIGKSITEIVPDVVESGRYERHKEVIRTGKPFVLEDFIPHPVFGDMHFILKSFKVGNGLGVIAADITERKKAEEELQEIRNFLQQVVDTSPNMIFVLNSDEQAVFVNQYTARYYETTPEELQLKSTQEVHHQDNEAKEFVSDDQTVISQRTKLEKDELNTAPNGEQHWFHTVKVPLVRTNGAVEVLVVSTDITERKQAEDALRDSEENLNKAQHYAHVGSWTWNIKTNQLKWSDEMYHIFGIDKSSFTGILADVIAQAIHPDDREKVEQSNRSTSEQGKPIALEYRIMWPDGTIRMVWGEAGELILDNDGNPSLLSGIVQDITERKQAEEQIQKQLERLNALHHVDNAIKSSNDLSTTLKIFLGEVTAQLKVDAASVLLFNKNTLTLDHAADRGFHSAALQYTKLGPGQGYAGRVILDRKTIHIPDLKKAENKLTEALTLAGENFTAYIGTPLIAKGQVVGVLEIFQRGPLAPAPEWFNFLGMLASQAAIAIDNAQLFENLQRSNFDLTLAYDATIESWSRVLDLRDKETEGHTQRVTSLTVKLARQMGVPDTDVIHIRRGALLHDIGKMGVPDSILHKPGKLTPEEWDIMHQHTLYAYEMLLPIHYLKPALDIPQYHHEKWDGTGYPHKLKGEEIPLAARIFAAVDVWDAVTSDRPYRRGWTKKKAIEYIKSESGRHFDPKVVETFLSLISHKV